MKRSFVRFLTVTVAMVSMLAMGMTASAAESYTVAEGDNLMKIAQEKYGDEAMWNVIYEANKEAIKKPTQIYSGQVIVIPDLAAPAAPAVQPEAVPAPAAPVVQPATAPAEMTLEEYCKDPEFKAELDAEIQSISGDGLDVAVVFKGNTMAAVISVDPSYNIEGMDEILNEAMEEYRPVIRQMVTLIENELGNPGNCAVIYRFQTTDGRLIAQKTFTAK